MEVEAAHDSGLGVQFSPVQFRVERTRHVITSTYTQVPEWCYQIGRGAPRRRAVPMITVVLCPILALTYLITVPDYSLFTCT